MVTRRAVIAIVAIAVIMFGLGYAVGSSGKKTMSLDLNQSFKELEEKSK